MVRRFLAVFAVLGVLALTVIPASASEAVVSVSAVPMVDDVPEAEKVPSMSLRAKMLTLTGSMLASDRGGNAPFSSNASGRAWAYSATNTGFSEKKLRNMMEFSTLNPGGSVPQRTQDYVLQSHEFETPIATDPNTGEKKVTSRFRAPTSVGSMLMKGGSALAGLTFVPAIGGLGSEVLGGWFGYDDVNAEWCGAFPSSNVGFQALHNGLSLLSARDCSMFVMDPDYVANADTATSVVVGSSVGGLTYLGLRETFGSTNPSSRFLAGCYAGSFADGTGTYEYQLRHPTTGAITWSSGFVGAGGTSFCPPSTYAFSRSYFYSGNTPLVTGLLRYKPSGVTDWQYLEEAPGDPERFLECVVTLDDGSVLVGEGAPYRESSGSFIPPACPPAPPGRYATDIAMNEHLVGSSGTPTVLYDEPTSEEYQEWSTLYPECADGACLLDLRVKSGLILGGSCFDMSDQCANWWSDPEKSDKYQCTYGAHDVAIGECAIYSGIFKSERVAVGAPYSDPMTGDWDGTASAPRLDGQAMSQAVQNPASARACTGLNITGFDPVGFVLRPIQCALEWAFVPRPLVVEAELVGGEASWDGKPPAVIAAAVGSFALTPAVSGCSKSVTIFSGVFEQTITPIDVCPGSMARPFADASRVVTAAVMVVLVIIVLRRQIAGMVGYGQGQ